MTSDFAAKIGLTLMSTNVGAQRIDGSPLETYSMVSAEFSLQDSLERVWFFEETFCNAVARTPAYGIYVVPGSPT